MIQFQNWIQPAKVAIPIVFMLLMFSWARKKEAIAQHRVRPIILVRVITSLVFMVFAFPVAAASVDKFPDAISFTASLVLCSFVFVIVKKFNKVEEAIYPEVKFREWNAQQLIINDGSWIFYMFGYEVFFRGFLLTYLLTETTMLLAIGLNVFVYAVSHIPKGKKEVFLSIPFGVLLCLITIYTGSFWCGFFIHCAVALTNEWFAIRARFFAGKIVQLNSN